MLAYPTSLSSEPHQCRLVYFHKSCHLNKNKALLGKTASDGTLLHISSSVFSLQHSSPSSSHSAKYVIRSSFDVTTKPDVETTLVIGCIWKFPGRLFTSRRFHDVVQTSFTSRCRHNISTTFATSTDVRKTFIYNQISMFFRRQVSAGDVLPSGTRKTSLVV